MNRILLRDRLTSECEIKVYFEALDLLSDNLKLQTTYLLILYVNEGDKWPAKSDFEHL